MSVPKNGIDLLKQTEREEESMVLALENGDPSEKADTHDKRCIFMFTLYFFTLLSEPMPT